MIIYFKFDSCTYYKCNRCIVVGSEQCRCCHYNQGCYSVHLEGIIDCTCNYVKVERKFR